MAALGYGGREWLGSITRPGRAYEARTTTLPWISDTSGGYHYFEINDFGLRKKTKCTNTPMFTPASIVVANPSLLGSYFSV